VNDDVKSANGTHWALDRRIPIAIISAIVLQSAGFVWGAATLWERVAVLEKRSESLSVTSDRLIRVEDSVTNLQARLEEKSANLQNDIRQVGYEIRQLASRFYFPPPTQVQPPPPLPVPAPPDIRPPHDP